VAKNLTPSRSITLPVVDGYNYIGDSLPAIFFVNKESRYEAARIDGGAWFLPDGASVYSSPFAYLNNNKNIWYKHCP
jgi:hypothetical protein